MTLQIPLNNQPKEVVLARVSIHFFGGQPGVTGQSNIMDGRFLIHTDSNIEVELGEIAIASISRPGSGIIRQIVEVVGSNDQSIIFNVVSNKRTKVTVLHPMS